MLNRFTAICGLASVFVCIAAMVLAHKEILSANSGALVFMASGVLGLASFAGAVGVLIFTRAYPIAMLGMVGLMPLVAVASAVTPVFVHPDIFDVSTDAAAPPALESGASFPPANATLIAQGYPELAPLQLNLPPDQAYARALEVAAQIPNLEITQKSDEQREFQGTAVSKLFRWKADFVVRARAADGGGTRLDMRSRSRDAQHDLGANARSITAFFKELKKYDVAPN